MALFLDNEATREENMPEGSFINGDYLQITVLAMVYLVLVTVNLIVYEKFFVDSSRQL